MMTPKQQKNQKGFTPTNFLTKLLLICNKQESYVSSGYTLSHRKEKLRGFTLLETLVAISILTIAITATFSAVQSGLSSSIESRDQINAFFLAQEAVEYIRNIRDTNSLNGQDWLTGISLNSTDDCFFGNSCIIDATKDPITDINALQRCSGACPYVRQDQNSSHSTYAMYGHDATWTQSPFQRIVQIQSVSGPTAAITEVLIVVTINWRKGTGVPRTFTIKESILDWQ